ncbi:hypothetical protein GCM10022406_40540 [Hymenobacter algoricola]|uniref:Uncharacterized protein n=2 Tax=Hymenobacter algoricola TaxID=486267 RepID=A0ABP7NVL0_9BACT
MALSAAAQQQPPAATVPFGRANVVLVKTTARPDSVLAELRHYLDSNGFMLDTLDPARGLITTQVQESGQILQEQMKIRAVRVADGWKLTGLYLIGSALADGHTAFPAEFVGFDWSPAKVAFRQVEAAARAVPRGTLHYGRAKVRFSALTKLEDALRMPW